MDELIIAGRSFNSRLMVGTGKFASNEAMVASMEGSGSEIVTVALRRVDVDNPQDSLLSHIDPKRYLLLPNTSGYSLFQSFFYRSNWPPFRQAAGQNPEL